MQHVDAFPITGDGMSCVPVVVSLHPVEREGVVAQKVLPGEEQGLGSGAYSQAHGVEGGQVIGLFINMHNLWLQASHVGAQVRVEVKMEMPVEGHLLYQ